MRDQIGNELNGDVGVLRLGARRDGQPLVAFALGGLGGSNAHGAGFLQAARMQGLKPDLITCSSGQMHWAAAFLQGKDLPALLDQHVDLVKEYPESLKPLSTLMLTLVGLPGVFRPSWHDAFTSMIGRPPPLSFREFLDMVLPARQMVPTRNPSFFKEISDCFNGETDTGVIFNSYNPVEGKEYVHLNQKALEITGWHYGYRYGRREVRPITPEYVEAGLWLMLYGFEKQFHGEYIVDGAYFRGTLLTECLRADTVFVPRALSKSWVGPLPKNFLEVMDFWTELLFQGTYAAELHAVGLVNEEVAAGRNGLLAEWANNKPVELVEIEVAVQRGFFDYFTESKEVFNRAVADSTPRIRQWRQNWAARQAVAT